MLCVTVEAHVEGIEGRPPAHSQQRTEVFHPTALEEPDPANSCVSDLEVAHLFV